MHPLPPRQRHGWSGDAYVPCSDEHLDCFPTESCALHDSECQTKVNTLFRRLIEWGIEQKKLDRIGNTNQAARYKLVA